MPSAATLASLGKNLDQVTSLHRPGRDSRQSIQFACRLTARKGTSRLMRRKRYSSYNGLALQLNKRVSDKFSYILAYTWSHS